jgi:hypothetical protein
MSDFKFDSPIVRANEATGQDVASAMTLSFGVKAPLIYSVFADAAAALLLATSQALNLSRPSLIWRSMRFHRPSLLPTSSFPL